MTAILGPNSYGKSRVRLVKVTRRPDRHDVTDLTVDVALEGDFDAAHTRGDNAGLLATDTMRNTVYALAHGRPIDEIEAFGARLVEHFLQAGPSVTRARVHLVEHPWARLKDGDGRPHEHAFQRAQGGTRVATLSGGAGGRIGIEAGIDGLVVLRTTGSGWEGYLQDRYTSLAETDDRIMATEITARWAYRDADVDFGAAWHDVRRVVLGAFGDHYSPSVQFTLHRMGEAVLEARPEVERISFSLPNRHHLLYDLSRFGLENDNEIFQATEEPYGLMEGTVERGPEAAAEAAASGAERSAR
ncbi:MAG: urate oxidase [Solirubrobacteraceae bacterium]|jgi:urate oxidase|nr:urate oxidase [Solirubrobacteraceae bacterium]